MKEYVKQLDDTEKYIKPGNQTLLTPEIFEISSKFEGETLKKSEQAIEFVSTFERKGFDMSVFRKRTGIQIINDKYFTGCTDFALAFITLIRSCGIPAKYVETIDEKWLREGGNQITGHVYSQFYDKENNTWRWADPMSGKIDADPEFDSRIIFRIGLDSWDIGIYDYFSLNEVMSNFRDSWLRNN